MKLSINDIEDYKILLDKAALNGYTDVQLPLSIARIMFDALTTVYEVGTLQTEEIQ